VQKRNKGGLSLKNYIKAAQGTSVPSKEELLGSSMQLPNQQAKKITTANVKVDVTEPAVSRSTYNPAMDYFRDYFNRDRPKLPKQGYSSNTKKGDTNVTRETGYSSESTQADTDSTEKVDRDYTSLPQVNNPYVARLADTFDSLEFGNRGQNRRLLKGQNQDVVKSYDEYIKSRKEQQDFFDKRTFGEKGAPSEVINLRKYLGPKRAEHNEKIKNLYNQRQAGMINDAQFYKMRNKSNMDFYNALEKDPEYIKLKNKDRARQERIDPPRPPNIFRNIKDYVKEIQRKKSDLSRIRRIRPTISKQFFGDEVGQLKFNKGGIAMEQQMELFNEGGLKDEGGMTDKESGNNVPSGSSRAEVRDDVPAMLSEGEFVLPADVVRFIGLDRLMQIRQDAKMGLKKMEAMGQMGNSDEAVIPDDMPFDMDDIIVIEDDEDEEMYMGGDVGGDDDVMNMNLEMAIGGDVGGDDDVMSMEMAEGGATPSNPYASKNVKYINSQGDVKYIVHDYLNRPMTAIPSGYSVAPDQDGKEATPTKPMPDENQQPVNVDQDDNRPQRMIEDADNAAKITADRLGIPLEEYKNLPMKTRFALMGHEIGIMTGKAADPEKIKQIIETGSDPDGGGFGIMGGLLGGIASFFDKDGDGSMFTSTSKDGIVTNWFGQQVGDRLTASELAKLGSFNNETNRWEDSGIRKIANRAGIGSKVSGTPSPTTPPISRPKTSVKKPTIRGRDSTQFKATSGISTLANKIEKKPKDQGDKGIAAETAASNREKGRDDYTVLKERKAKRNAAIAKDANENQASYEEAAFGNKGMLISKPSATKKPTPKRKTLVTRKS